MDRSEWERARHLLAQEREREYRRTAEFCGRVWSEAITIEGTPAEAYLYSRGLLLEDVPDLRFHMACPRMKPDPDRRPQPPLPALVALIRDPAGEPRALHTTSLQPDGRGKADVSKARLIFGRYSGCAVRLQAAPVAGVLAVGEGIETVASFSALKGVPGWALLSTSGFASFMPPAGTLKLIVAADNDENGAGLRAANALAERACQVCDVEVRPAPAGRDWNDAVRAQL